MHCTILQSCIGIVCVIPVVVRNVQNTVQIGYQLLALIGYNLNMHEDDIPLEQKLNLDTGKITWPELQRHFARGVIIIVSPQLDLIEVAQSLVNNDANQIENLIKSAHLTRANDEHAHDWQTRDPLFWAVVVAPWVLVQEICH